MTDQEMSIFVRGGPVVWLLAVLGVVVLVLFVERAIYLQRVQIRSTEFLNGIRNLLQKGRLMEALTLCEEAPGPVAAMVKAALRHAREDEQALRLVMQDAALTEIPILERRINVLAAVAQVAPLLGLLGALVGMARTFWLFNQGGEYATPSVLAGGMWEALLAAIAGLAVAVPAHLARHFLAGRVQVLVNDMEWAGNELLRILCVEWKGTGEKQINLTNSGSGVADKPAK